MALIVSLLAAYWTTENPPLQANTECLLESVELAADRARELLNDLSKSEWDNTLEKSGLDEMTQALDELNDLVSEVLTCARLQISAPDLSYSAISITPLITRTIDHHKSQNIAINIDHDTVSPNVQIEVDAHHFGRAINNLVTNAIKYGNKKVLISWRLNEHQLQINIDDDGEGIAPENRERALNPFVRLDSSRAKHLGGSGLGLAIAAGVAYKLNGTLTIHKSPLGGARLSMIVPLTQL